MSKRTSGLGRGLGDLLADNAPEMRGGATVIRRDEDGEVTITPDKADAVETAESESPSELSEVGGVGASEKEKESAEAALWESSAKDLSDSAAEESVSSAPTVIISSSAQQSHASEKVGGDPATVGDTARVAEEPHYPHRSIKSLFKNYK